MLDKVCVYVFKSASVKRLGLCEGSNQCVVRLALRCVRHVTRPYTGDSVENWLRNAALSTACCLSLCLLAGAVNRQQPRTHRCMRHGQVRLGWWLWWFAFATPCNAKLCSMFNAVSCHLMSSQLFVYAYMCALAVCAQTTLLSHSQYNLPSDEKYGVKNLIQVRWVLACV